MIHRYNIGIVIVTYNRLECLKKCIDLILQQTYKNTKIFLIDNCSNDGTEEYCYNLVKHYCEKIDYHRLDENMGGSFGFCYGMKAAVKQGCEFVWGMDDDAYPNKDALEILIKNAEKHGIYDNGFWSNINSHKEYVPGGVDDIGHWTFVGFFLSTELIKTIGFPRNDLFIFFDDAEYGFRITKQIKRRIYRVNDSIIIHEGTIKKVNNEDEFYKRKILWKTFRMQKLPSWKWYYLARNRILIHRKFSDMRELLLSFMYSVYLFLKSLILHKEYAGFIFRGIIDGITNTTGAIVRP